MTHARDPRLRRRTDPLEAAVRLGVAVDAMRAQQSPPGPEFAYYDETTEVTPQLAAAVVSAAQLGTVEPPLTAQEFADALAAADDVAESPEPVAVTPPPEPPAPVPAPRSPVFSSERGRALDWRSRHDERSRLYGVRAVMAGSAPLADHLWPVGPVLDQGAEGACVGFALADAVNVLELGGLTPSDGKLCNDGDALGLYERAQELDEVPGEDYTGTSVLAGMQAGVEAGLFGGYRWAFGTKDVAQAVLQLGPVVIGIPWLSGMYDTGPGGLVTPAGDPVGGHCLAVVGIRLRGPQGQPGPFFVWQNSWGPDYGDGGLGYIHHRDLAGLLHGAGEAAIPTATAQVPA